MAGKVRVVAPDGTRGEIPEESLIEAISEGYTPEAQYDAQQREAALQAEYGDTGGQLIAGAQGAARGLTLGLSDVASAAITGGALALTDDAPRLTPEARERMAELGIEAPKEKSQFATGYDSAREYQDNIRAANPGTALASEVAGAVLPALAGGALAYAPAALAERAGAKAATLGARAGTGLGAAALGGAARGATEGAIGGLLVGATRLNSEQVQDPELAVEHVLTAAGEGLVLGGGIGGLLGTAAHGLKVAGSKLDEMRRPAPEVAPVTATAEVMPRAVDLDTLTVELEARPLTAAALPDTRVRGKFATLLERQEAAQGGFENAVQAETAAIRNELDTVLRDIDQVDEFAGIAAKRRANELNVGYPVSTHEVDAVLDGMGADITAFRGRNSATALAYDGGLSTLERVTNVIDDQRQAVAAALKQGNVGEAYSQLDTLKRTIGRARGTRSASVQDVMEGQYKQIQTFMEDEGIWGELAARQRVANAAWSDRISAGKDARVRQFVAEAGGNANRAANEWDQLKLARSDSVHGLLQNVGDVRVADVEEAFRRQLRSMARDATERTKAWGSQELQQRAERIVNTVRSIEDRMDGVALVRRDMMAGQQQLRSSAVDALASVAGVLNPAAGFAVSGTMRLGRGLVQGIAGAGAGVGTKVAQGAAQLVRGAGVVATIGAGKAPMVAGSSQGMLAQEKFDAAIQEAQQLSQAGSPATQELIRQGAALEQEDPRMAEAYVGKTLQRAAYIAEKLPKAPSAGIFAPKPALDPMTERKLQRTVSAAYEPAKALDRIVRTLGSPEDVDALKKLYPAMYRSFVAQVQQHLERMPEPPDYQTRMKISQLTGLPLDASMTPAGIARAQKAAAMPDQKKAGEQQAKQKRQAAGPKMGGRDRDDVYAANVDSVLDRR